MIDTRPQVTWLGETLTVDLFQYGNGRIAFVLVDQRGRNFAKPTVNVPELEIAEDEVLVKLYGENRGALEALTRGLIVRDTGRRVRVGPYPDALAAICQCLIRLPTAAEGRWSPPGSGEVLG